MQNLLRIDYEKILLLSTLIFRGDYRIVPFFIDVISNIFEENYHEGPGSLDFSICDTETPYPSLNELPDHVIFSIFDREKTRHKISIDVEEMVQLFCVLNASFGESWDCGKTKEVIEMLYDSRAQGIFDSLKRNPLLKVKDDCLIYKYNFLSSYFNTLYVFYGINSKTKESEFMNVISNLGAESVELRDLKRYYSACFTLFMNSSKSILKERKKVIKNSDSTIDIEKAKSGVEFITTLLAGIKGDKKGKFTQLIKELYSVGESGVIDNLYIKGDLPPLDFTNMNVSNSRFRSFPRFLGNPPLSSGC